MKVDPKALVRRLTPTATRVLEAAVGRAATGQFYEIVPEHVLLVLLEADGSDAALVLSHFGKNRQALLSRVERTVAALRAGNGGRPVFSQALFSWLRDAWLVASVERGASLLRTGDLLATFAEHTDRYSAESYPELELPFNELRAQLVEVTAQSPEAREALGSLETKRGEASAGHAGRFRSNGGRLGRRRWSLGFGRGRRWAGRPADGRRFRRGHRSR